MIISLRLNLLQVLLKVYGNMVLDLEQIYDHILAAVPTTDNSTAERRQGLQVFY